MGSLEQITELLAARQKHEAAEGLAKLVAKRKLTGATLAQAIGLASDLGDQDTALAAARAFAAEDPTDLRRQFTLIEALSGAARHKEALGIARALQADAAAPDAFYAEGVLRARFGERDVALSLFRRALAARPDHTPSWEQIALLNGHADLSADLAVMEALRGGLRQPALKVPLLYALGRAYDFAGEPDIAFARIFEGAALRRAAAPFAIEPQLAYMQRLERTFTPALIESLAGDAARGEDHIFIIGPQRSGTTLIEQILAAARGVSPTGEHTLLRLATLRLGSMEPQEMASAAQLPREAWKKMAAAYRMSIARRFGSAKFYTDKTLIHHFFAGVIRILFPRSKIIWCQRDPRDVVWSCYRSRITQNRWTEDLSQSCLYVTAYNALCSHWKGVFGDTMHIVSYEELVAQPDRETAALFDFCGVERPANWTDFFKQANPVATASLAQVREPLNAKAVGSWRRYEKHLKAVYEKHFPDA